jgi:hypothetical protein
MVWDVSKWDQCKSGDGKLFGRMIERLRELDPTRKKSANQQRDILIAETAIKLGAILISGDENLRQVVAEFGGYAIA